MVIFCEQVPDTQNDSNRPVNDAERGKRGDSTVKCQPLRLRQPYRPDVVRQRNAVVCLSITCAAARWAGCSGGPGLPAAERLPSTCGFAEPPWIAVFGAVPAAIC